jgi:DNA-binding response OmpR family regulator
MYMAVEHAKILYVEDDKTLSFITKENLERKGYSISFCEDGEQALRIFKSDNFDLCLLDVMIPKIDGFTVAKEIRKVNKDIPLIFLTARSLQEDKIHGLMIGADDYLVKPFSIEELYLKIEVFLKRKYVTGNAGNKQLFKIGGFTLNFDSLKLIYMNNEMRLTYREAELLRLLIINENTLLKRETILKSLWKEDDYFLGRSMDVFISRLRKYLKPDPNIKIENVHGTGFILRHYK